MGFRTIKVSVAFLLLSIGSSAFSCKAKSATDIMAALDRGIELNERFKRSARATSARYQSLREQAEQYDEATTMPCAEKAGALLQRELDVNLLRQLMRLTVSYENSADERIALALAGVLRRHPQAVSDGIEAFSPAEARLLLRSMEFGWINIRDAVPIKERAHIESTLTSIRAALSKTGASK
jgi:hypothetical protein